MEGEGGTHHALFCDTNVLVRLLTGEPPHQTRAVQRLLESDQPVPILLPDVVFAELCYVLTEVVGLERTSVAEGLHSILDVSSVIVVNEQLLHDAVEIWVEGTVDFADAYLAALARLSWGTGVLSFDRDFDRIEGVTRVDPGRIR